MVCALHCQFFFFHSHKHSRKLLFFPRLHDPAAARLVADAGDEGDDVLRAVVQHTHIIHTHLVDGMHRIAAGAELSGQLDGIPNVKGVNFAKVIIGVVPCKCSRKIPKNLLN